MKIGLNIRNNESVICANFGDARSHDRELRLKNTAIFDLKMYLFAYNSTTTWHAQLKFVQNVGAYECLMQTEFGGARSCDQNFTDRKWAKS